MLEFLLGFIVYTAIGAAVGGFGTGVLVRTKKLVGVHNGIFSFYIGVFWPVALLGLLAASIAVPTYKASHKVGLVVAAKYAPGTILTYQSSEENE